MNKVIRYPEPNKRYKHYKGGLYKVLKLAKHTETNEDMVVYESVLFGTVYVRPLRMWFEDVNVDGEIQPRFIEAW